MKIVNDRLTSVPFVRANSSGGRQLARVIILHDTADRPTRSQDTVSWFANKKCRVSAHVVVGRDGSVTQMVDFDRKAWHAGRSSFKGRRGVNSFGVGIEIDNPGKLSKSGRAWFTGRKEKPISGIEKASTKQHGSGYWLPYTPEQVETVIEICKSLVKEYPTIKDISTHWEISPGRKIDTNPLFPVDDVKTAVFNPKPEKPKPKPDPNLQIGSDGPNVIAAQKRLKALGYPIGDADGDFGSQTRVAVLAYQAENGRKTNGTLSPDDMIFLKSGDAKSMPIAERAEVTAKELKDKGSKTVTYTSWGKTALKWFGIPAISGVAIDDGAGVNTALKGLEAARDTVGRGNDLLFWLMSPKGLFLVGALGLGFGGWWLLNKIESRRVAKAQNATDLSV